MKTKVLVIALLFAAEAALTQTQPLQFEAIRLRRSRSSVLTGRTQNDCVSVTAEGVFRWEHEFPDVAGGKSTHIYEGKLAPADLNALLTAINNEGFNAVQTQPPPSGVTFDAGDHIGIHVLRGGSWKHLQFWSDAARRKYKKNLKPLLAWWAAFEKKKITPSNATQPTICRVPGTPDDGGMPPGPTFK